MYQNRQIIPTPQQVIAGIPTPQDFINQVVQELSSPLVALSRIPTPAEVMQQLPSPKRILQTVPTPLEMFNNPPKVKDILGPLPTHRELQAPYLPPVSTILPTPGQWYKRMEGQFKKNPLAPLDMLVDVVDTFLPG